MKVSYEESLANCFGLKQRCDEGNDIVLSVCREGSTGQLLSSEILVSVCRPCPDKGKAILLRSSNGENGVDTAESVNLACAEILSARTGRSHQFLVQSFRANCGDGQRTSPRESLA